MNAMPSCLGATFVGVHIGTNRDPSAIAIAEMVRRTEGEGTGTHFHLRFLEAMATGTRYSDIAQRTADACSGIRNRGRSIWTVFVNLTGTGAPPLDLIREKLPSERVIAVYFNHGDRRTEAEGSVNLGKALLVSRLKLLLQTNRLHLPQTEVANSLGSELLEFHHVLDPRANERYGAFRVGTRDELVTALGLASQMDHPTTTTVWDLADTWGRVEDLLR
jgi:hypothetical protein